jgi:hypothetical protein
MKKIIIWPLISRWQIACKLKTITVSKSTITYQEREKVTSRLYGIEFTTRREDQIYQIAWISSLVSLFLLYYQLKFVWTFHSPIIALLSERSLESRIKTNKKEMIGNLGNYNAVMMRVLVARVGWRQVLESVFIWNLA